ncbi:MAG: cupin domain-containing protein [bacterium]|nr:cupin domain-containing protein [bacterium]
MRIKSLMNSKKVVAGDGVHLRELVNPGCDGGFTGRYSLAEAILLPGHKSKKHRLKTHELYFVVEGHAVVHLDEESAVIEQGDAVEIPPGTVQWVDNSGGSEPFVFLCIVDPAWRSEDEEMLE